MTPFFKRSGALAAAAIGLALCAPAAHAGLYAFTQGGYDEGATITGSLYGDDLNGDGRISSFDKEVTSLTVAFSGNSLVSAFTSNPQQYNNAVYDVGTPYIGDGRSGVGEGVATNWMGSTGFEYDSGYGLLGTSGGRVTDHSTGATSSTTQLIAVTAVVPEPEQHALFLAGMAVVAAVARQRRKSAG